MAALMIWLRVVALLRACHPDSPGPLGGLLLLGWLAGDLFLFMDLGFERAKSQFHRGMMSSLPYAGRKKSSMFETISTAC